MEDVQALGFGLHKACEAPQSLDDIQAILEACPEAAHVVTNSGGYMPIHTACLNQANDAVLKVLVRQDPACLTQKDAHGNYPLHLAAFSGAPLSSIKYLVNKNPETIFERNKAGETPLDRAKNPFFGVITKAVVDWLENPYFHHNDDFDDACADIAEATLETHTSCHADSNASTSQQQQQQHTSLPTFSKPLGVDETRLAISSLQRSKSDPNEGTVQDVTSSPRKAQNSNDETPETEVVDVSSPSKRSKKKVGSFYRSALREHAEMQTALQRPAALIPSRRPSDAEPQPQYPNVNANRPLPSSDSPSTSEQQQPGVVMVQEPAIHPNSAMYRAAYS